MGGRAGTRWTGLIRPFGRSGQLGLLGAIGLVAVLGLAGCASVDGKVDGKVDDQTRGKAVSGRELGSRLRAALAEKPTATAHLSGSTVGNGADGVLRLDRNAFAMSFQLAPASAGASATKMLIVPTGYYVGAGTKVNGKEWLKLIGDRIDPISTMLGGQVQAVESNVDLENIQRNLLVAKGVEEIGTETVGGVKATHYRMPMDNAAVKTQLPAGLPADQAQSILDQTTGVIDFYLGPDDLPVKIVNTVRNAQTKGVNTITYAKWGEPVSFPSPTAADTIDLGNTKDLQALDALLAKLTGQEPNTSPSVPALQP